MSTNIKHVKNVSITARQRRRVKRNIRMILFGILICIIIALTFFHIKRVQALNGQILDLEGQMQQLVESNEHLTIQLHEYQYKLQLFAGDFEVQVAGPTLYDIPLDAALQEYTYNMCVDYYIPEHYELMLALMWQESNFDASVVSSTDDYGLMQINDVNHDWLSEELGLDDFLDPEQNIHAGVFLMAKLIHKYGDVNKALMAYNMGERGATTYWNSGTYSSAYSNSVIAKYAAIKMNNYGSN